MKTLGFNNISANCDHGIDHELSQFYSLTLGPPTCNFYTHFKNSSSGIKLTFNLGYYCPSKIHII